MPATTSVSAVPIPERAGPPPAPKAPPVSPVSVFILAYNEEHKIEAALASVTWAGEIVVIDSFSTDRTAEIARRFGARVVQLEFERFGELRQAGITHTTQPWIFSLDADERCTPEARDEILRVIADPESADAYLVPRRNVMFGREIRHSGWYPDYRQPQLFRRGRMDYAREDHVHEGYVLRGRLGRLRHPILQIPYRTISEIIQKMDRYTTLNAAKLRRHGRTSRFPLAVLRGGWSFFRVYLLQLGFLDGSAGFLIALLRFENSFYKHAKCIEATEVDDARRGPA
ncbi:MAG TPA: glycosyltransferase family 2 protein [Opitutaceae bacterium]|nr:glycosyltransferase family 2 protein [Opitutaceae bacterium]